MEKDNKFYGINPENQEAEIDDFKCPNCHSIVSYSPDERALHCDNCGYNLKLDGQVGTEEFDLSEGKIEDQSWDDDAQVVECENCGASNVVEQGEISVCCPFCGSNHVIKKEELPGIKPHRVVPFKISFEEVRTSYGKWLKRKFYVPRKVKKAIPTIVINGVYLPVWTFDTNTISIYDGRLGKHYTQVVGSGKNRRVVTKTRYFHISGSKQVNFDDVVVNAGSQIKQEEINKISPFNTNDSLIYDNRYLVGFSSEHYEVRLNAGWDKAKITINSRIKAEILRRYSYDVVSYLNINSSYNDIKFKYVLIPVWIGNYKHMGKSYRFIANGENGKVTGKYPLSVFKIILTVILILAIVCLAVFYASGY